MLKTRFIINPISGINRNPHKIVRWIREIFSSHSTKFDVVYTQMPGDGTRIAREAVEAGFEVVAAVGGDGTINEVASGLVHTRTALGVIPAGSGNGFARNFNVPLDQRKAIQALLKPGFLFIDAGKINNHYFFNVAGAGLDAVISQNFEQFGMRGPLPYFWVGTQAFLNYKPTPVIVSLKGEERKFTPLILTIANAPQYGNGAIIAPAAKPDDGLLDVCILDPLPIWKAVPNLYRLFNGTIDQLAGFHSFQAESLTIKRSQPGAIHTDGNPVWEDETLHVQVLPGGLKLALGK